MSLTTGFFDAWAGYLSRRRDNREHRQTIDAVSDLPPHILRDIGWPGAYERQRKHHRDW